MSEANFITIPDNPVLDDKIDKYSRLYAYDQRGYHSGGRYIVNACSDGSTEISLRLVRPLIDEALKISQQIRITNGDDFLIFWCANGSVIHCAGGEGLDRFMALLQSQVTDH